MLFGRKNDTIDPVAAGLAELRHKRGLDALEKGEVSPDTLERFRSGPAHGDLTCNEFLLAREAGAEERGMVMGSSFYKFSYLALRSGVRPTSSGELPELTSAMIEARRLAMHRMKQEATALGANGVIGVRLTAKRKAWDRSHLEFTAIGTAIRLPDYPPMADPFTSDLSGQDFWKLHAAGYLPRGLVFGLSCYYVATRFDTMQVLTNTWFSGMANQEIIQFTAGLSKAREIAVKRLRAETEHIKGEGTVGMEIEYEMEENEYEYGNTKHLDLIITFSALGTAIIRNPHATPAPAPSPLIIIDLASGRSGPIQSAAAKETH
ncbi:MAG: heavy metal-binding domain-containing protein [Bacteroidota bacterium]